jgi:pyruvate dehydrogenase E2 component (dihydrolipoamide acetyltransferase)
MAQVVEMPKLGFDMAEGTLVRWVKAEGEMVAKGQVLAEIETDKATVEVESTYDGTVHSHLVEEKAVVPVGTPIAIIAAAGESVDLQALLGVKTAAEKQDHAPKIKAEKKIEKKHQSITNQEGQLPGGIKASPLARSLAKASGVDLSAIMGSGPGGRIIRRDIEVYMHPPTAQKTPSFIPDGENKRDVVVPLNRLRAAIGRRMTESKQRVPHFYVTHEFNTMALMALREQVNHTLQEGENKLSVNDFIVKAVAMTLGNFPNLNAAFQENQIIQYGHIHIGVAVAIEGGLLTVVCHDADLKPLRQISSELHSMTQRAREGQVRPEDIEGSTFSISNLGMFDVEHFVAIINPPESAILAIGSVKEVAVVEEGNLRVGSRMKTSLSVDHRISDGAEAARFLQALGEYLEKPIRLMV